MKKLKDLLNENFGVGILPSDKMFSYNKATGKYDKPKIQKVNEIHSASGTPEFNKLVKILQSAVKQAEKVAKDAKQNPGAYEGSEGSDVGLLLEEIYAAFSTGNHKDKTYNDEIFK